jgi:hypothetical protein
MATWRRLRRWPAPCRQQIIELSVEPSKQHSNRVRVLRVEQGRRRADVGHHANCMTMLAAASDTDSDGRVRAGAAAMHLRPPLPARERLAVPL